jgi:hypothetical protein
MKLVFLFALLLVRMAVSAQSAAVRSGSYASVDARAAQWPDSVTVSIEKLGAYVHENFQTESDKIRAIFVWIADNIQYDVDNMFAINFYEADSDKIAKPLRTRKGICENYSALFAAVCRQVGIQAIVVEGYTKQRGFVDYIPHAWCAAFTNGAWRLFDPTWGSGYMEDGRFVKRLDEEYFNASPEKFIRSHMPFDYLWQFLYYPISNQAFYEGKTTQDKTVTPYFNYPDSIKAREALPPLDREAAEAIRVEKNGVRNSLIFDRLRHIKVDIENAKRQAESDHENLVIDAYNSALKNYNSGVILVNVFIGYRNDQFKPLKPDSVIQQMIDTAARELSAAKVKADAIVLTDADKRMTQLLQSLKDSLDEAMAHVRKQQDWLAQYLAKNKMGRKAMFYQ